MINNNRIIERFTMLAQIDSVSREEAQIADKLKEILTGMGADVFLDSAGEKVGGNSGNLIAKFKGSTESEPILLSGHMDTVEPGRGVKVQFKNGVFRSDGTTILGSDDKSALVIILEVMDVILENNLPYPPIEIVFTICEEVGLLGAKHFDLSMIDARTGYILDSTDPEGIVTRAPSANHFTIKVHGKDAHAGAFPEKGINAISVAARAISQLELGRIDHETTCNLGKIEGGKATNIVPDLVTIHGEARSHDKAKLKAVTETIFNAFHNAVETFRKEKPKQNQKQNYNQNQKRNHNQKQKQNKNQNVNEDANEDTNENQLPRVEIEFENDFPATHIPDDHIVVKLAKSAARNLGTGKVLVSKTSGGGADANIFFGKGVVTGVLGTGMTDVHTVRESIKLEDMENTARLLLEILKIHAAGTLEDE